MQGIRSRPTRCPWVSGRSASFRHRVGNVEAPGRSERLQKKRKDCEGAVEKNDA